MSKDRHSSGLVTFREHPFPGWRWVAVAFAFPVAGLIGWKIGGRVDGVAAAVVGGALTGAGLGAVEWWAADGARSHRRVGRRKRRRLRARARGRRRARSYETDLAALGAMGLVSGAAIGLAQAVVLSRRGNLRLALACGCAMPVLFALSSIESSLAGRAHTR